MSLTKVTYAMIDGSPLSVLDYGADPTGVADSTAAFVAWASALSNNSEGVIPPGSYKIDTTSGPIGFAANNITITANGALITQYGTNAIAFDLNTTATATETSIKNNVRWFGGRFANSTSGLSGNTNTGIRARGITRGCIAHVFGAEHGNAFIQPEVTDGFYIYDCHGFNNGTHILFGEYQTTNANPQAINITDCGFSIHYTAGISVKSTMSDLNIGSCYFIGNDAIVIETGSSPTYGSFNNQNINIFQNTFEQGTTGNFYIKTVNTNTRTLFNLNIENNNFQTPTTKCIELKSVSGCVIEGNRFVSTEAGLVDIDANCLRITFGYNEYFGFASYAQGLTFACSREQIYFTPSTRFRDVLQLTGWNFSGISTGTGTLDMSTLIGSYWTGDPQIKFCPPKAYCIRIVIEDSGTASDLGFRLAKDVSEDANYSANALLDDVAAGQKQVFEFWVNADDAGDLYYSATASGANTLKVRLLLVGLQY